MEATQVSTDGWIKGGAYTQKSTIQPQKRNEILTYAMIWMNPKDKKKVQ